MVGREFKIYPELPAKPYTAAEKISKVFVRMRSSVKSSNGYINAISKAGIVKTNRTHKSTFSTPAKCFCICGKEGAIVAPAITVRVLAKSRVALVGIELTVAELVIVNGWLIVRRKSL
jgi:hypothetical protein